MLFFFSVGMPSKNWAVPTGENSTFLFLVQLNCHFFPFILPPCPKAVLGTLMSLSWWIVQMAPGEWAIELLPLFSAVSLSRRRWTQAFHHSYEIGDSSGTYFTVKTWDKKERRFPGDEFLLTPAHHLAFAEFFQGFIFHSILIDTPGSMYYQSHFSEMKRTRQNGEVMCPRPRGREAARQRPGHRSSDMCRIQASFFSFLAAFPVLWKESKPGRINNNNKSKINDRLFSICHVLDSILITSGTLLLPPFHNFWGLSSAFPLKEETGFQIG